MRGGLLSGGASKYVTIGFNVGDKIRRGDDVTEDEEPVLSMDMVESRFLESKYAPGILFTGSLDAVEFRFPALTGALKAWRAPKPMDTLESGSSVDGVPGFVGSRMVVSDVDIGGGGGGWESKLTTAETV